VGETENNNNKYNSNNNNNNNNSKNTSMWYACSLCGQNSIVTSPTSGVLFFLPLYK